MAYQGPEQAHLYHNRDRAIVRPHEKSTETFPPPIYIKPYTEQDYQQEKDEITIKCAPLEIEVKEAEQRLLAAREQAQALAPQTLDPISIQEERERLAERQASLQSANPQTFFHGGKFIEDLKLVVKRSVYASKGAELPELTEIRKRANQLIKAQSGDTVSAELLEAKSRLAEEQESLERARGRLKSVKDAWVFDSTNPNFGDRVFYYILENTRNSQEPSGRLEESIANYQHQIETEFHSQEVARYIKWCIDTGQRDSQAINQFLLRVFPSKSQDEYEVLARDIFQIEDPSALLEYLKDAMSQLKTSIYRKGGREIRENLAVYATENLKSRLREKGVNRLSNIPVYPYFMEQDATKPSVIQMPSSENKEVTTDQFRGFSILHGEIVDITEQNLKEVISRLLPRNQRRNTALTDDLYKALISIYKSFSSGERSKYLQKLKDDLVKEYGATHRVATTSLRKDNYRIFVSFHRESEVPEIEIIDIPHRDSGTYKAG